jgi:hypothetical protein
MLGQPMGASQLDQVAGLDCKTAAVSKARVHETLATFVMTSLAPPWVYSSKTSASNNVLQARQHPGPAVDLPPASWAPRMPAWCMHMLMHAPCKDTTD